MLIAIAACIAGALFASRLGTTGTSWATPTPLLRTRMNDARNRSSIEQHTGGAPASSLIASSSPCPVRVAPSRCPAAPSPCPAASALPPLPELTWTPLSDLTTVFAGSPLAAGCPPRPELCTLNHVFDAVVVISIPRLERASRVTGQLNELHVSYTLAHSRDTREPFFTRFFDLVKSNKFENPGEFALWYSQLAVLDAVASSKRLKSVLLLEDDIFLSANFPTEFDAVARSLPESWKALWLGGTPYQLPTGVKATVPGGVITPVRLWGAFAVGFRGEAIGHMLAAMTDGWKIIDNKPYEQLLQRWPGDSLLCWPALAAVNLVAGSSMDHVLVYDTAEKWSKMNNIKVERFSFTRGYHAGGENGTILQSTNEPGTRRSTPDKAINRQVNARSTDDCVTACIHEWPYCAAWTWVKVSGACTLHYTTQSLITVIQHANATSGVIQEDDRTEMAYANNTTTQSNAEKPGAPMSHSRVLPDN